MATADQIVITTGSQPYELAPAVLTVLEAAGNTGLERPGAIADAVCERFQVPRGTRIVSVGRVQPDYNINWAVTYLKHLSCTRQGTENLYFITTEGRDLLKMPLDDIQNLVKVIAAAGRTKNKERELEIISEMAEDALDGAIDQDDLDTRVRRRRETVVRIGDQFRANLMDAYQGRCAITGSRVAQVLQAAHIKPYRGPHTDPVTNGLILRVDLHQLFDKDLIGIDPDTREVRLSERLDGTEYGEFRGRRLAEPRKVGQRPARHRLKFRWDGFLEAEKIRKVVSLK